MDIKHALSQFSKKELMKMIQKSGLDVESLIRDFTHENEKLKMNKENNSKELQMCDICKKNVQCKNYNKHVESKVHLRKVSKVKLNTDWKIKNPDKDYKKETIYCNGCSKHIKLYMKDRHDRSNAHKLKWKGRDIIVAYNNLYNDYTSYESRLRCLNSKKCTKNIDSQLQFSEEPIGDKIRSYLVHGPVDVIVQLNIKFKTIDKIKQLQIEEFYSNKVRVFRPNELERVMNNMFEEISNTIDEYVLNRPGLEIYKIESQYTYIKRFYLPENEKAKNINKIINNMALAA